MEGLPAGRVDGCKERPARASAKSAGSLNRRPEGSEPDPLEAPPKDDGPVAAASLKDSVDGQYVVGEDDLTPPLIDALEDGYLNQPGFIFERHEDDGPPTFGRRSLAGDDDAGNADAPAVHRDGRG